MIQGKIEAVSTKAFVTKAGADMFKIGIKIEGAWYNSVSKFEEQRFKKGDEVFFETQTDYPDSVVMGTIKVINAAFAAKATTHTTTGQDILIKQLQKEVEDLKRRLKDAQDDAALKELNDELPF